jgi:hypothetical protein
MNAAARRWTAAPRGAADSTYQSAARWCDVVAGLIGTQVIGPPMTAEDV